MKTKEKDRVEKKSKKDKSEKVSKKDKSESNGSSKGGLTQNRIDTLKALRHGKELSHAEIAEVTGRTKGNKLRELTEEGYVDTVKEEEGRGYTYKITKKGRTAIGK
jgi:DNA-binding transcriptional ArsR family regulator